MESAVNAFKGETPFYLNFGRHHITSNVQEFGIKLAQVDTLREEYAHHMTASVVGRICAITKYSPVSKKPWRRLS